MSPPASSIVWPDAALFFPARKTVGGQNWFFGYFPLLLGYFAHLRAFFSLLCISVCQKSETERRRASHGKKKHFEKKGILQCFSLSSEGEIFSLRGASSLFHPAGYAILNKVIFYPFVGFFDE